MKAQGHSDDYGNTKADKLAKLPLLINNIDENGEYFECLISYVRFVREKETINREEKFDKTSKHLEVGTKVFIRTHCLSSAGYGLAKKLFQKYEGPYAIIDRIGRNTYLVEDSESIFSQIDSRRTYLHISN